MKNTKSTAKSLSLVKLQLVREKEIEYIGRITNPMMAAAIFIPFFKSLDREAFCVLSLDSCKNPLSINLVSLGNPNSAPVYPREVFKPALLSNADSIIVAHNHPSGNNQVSDADIRITKKLMKAGDILGISLNDHIIIYGEGRNDFTSFIFENLL